VGKGGGVRIKTFMPIKNQKKIIIGIVNLVVARIPPLFKGGPGGISAYKPKETALTIEALKAKHESLKQTNSADIAAEAMAEAARTQRDNLLHADKTGLVDIAMDSKYYIKSAYGVNSAQYKAISGIRFTRKKMN